MKKRSAMNYIIIAVLALFLVILFARPADNVNKRNVTMAKITLETPSGPLVIDAEISDNNEKRETGLMFRKTLKEDSSMLFVFPNEDYHAFWMKNTLIPLDIIFISSDMRIVDIKENFLPCTKDPCEVYRPEEKATYVLEVNTGFAAKNRVVEGDIVHILPEIFTVAVFE